MSPIDAPRWPEFSLQRRAYDSEFKPIDELADTQVWAASTNTGRPKTPVFTALLSTNKGTPETEVRRQARELLDRIYAQAHPEGCGAR